MRKNYYLCPQCKQDLRTLPHDGLDGKDCSQCGQGIQWRRERLRRRIRSEMVSVKLSDGE